MRPWNILLLVIAGLTILTLTIVLGDDSASQQVKASPCESKAQVVTCKNT